MGADARPLASEPPGFDIRDGGDLTWDLTVPERPCTDPHLKDRDTMTDLV